MRHDLPGRAVAPYRRRGRARALGTLLLAAAPGCAAVRRPPATAAALAADGVAAAAAHRAAVDTMVDRLARRAARRGDRTLDLLLLSGGGQNGAYGAGFLRGWASRPGAPAPRFDLVTGVSTGALQAPFALVGTRAAYDTLSALYARAADRIAPTVDWLFWLRRTGGLVKTARYERTIAAVVDERMRADLEAAFAEDRQLAVATTDYDLGVGRLWDVRPLLAPADTTAAARARALDATRRVFYTSTAIPGIFPPRVLGDGHVHGDGGVVSNVLPVFDFAAYRALADRLRARGVIGPGDERPVTVRLWVVMNLWTHAAPQPVNPASRRAVNRRSNSLLFWAQQPQLVEALATLGRAVSAGVPGLRLEVRATAVPAAVALEPGAGKLFDQAFMARLDSVGLARARSAAMWELDADSLSPYARPAAAASAVAAPLR